MIKKIYVSDKSDSGSAELRAYRNESGNLFVALDDSISPYYGSLFAEIPTDDAKELIKELAYEFDLLYDDPDRNFMPTWK